MTQKEMLELLKQIIECKGVKLPNDLAHAVAEAVTKLRKQSLSGVEYMVVDNDDSNERYFDNPNDAAVDTINKLVSRGEATIDVLVYSEEGAANYGGDDAVARYQEDPEASVFERFEFKCNCVGRVP